MRKSNWTPSIVPRDDDHNIYLVMDDLGRQGRVWREANAETPDLETIIFDLLEGQYKSPIRVVFFNTAEQWSQDVSADVAHELRRRCDLQQRDIRSSCRISSIATKAAIATSSCRSRSGRSRRWRSSAKSRRRWGSRRPTPEGIREDL